MKRLRQAREADGVVSVLCFACRRTKDGTKQQGLGSFFSAKPKADDAQADTAAPAAEGVVQCSKCLRVMESGGAGAASSGASKARVLPQIARIRQYQRVAAEQGVPFAIADGAAAALMRLPCVCCGVAAPTEGHGLTRLRVWPEGLERPARGGFMGPFAAANLATACATCNLMKGARRVRGFVEACRHIATHRGGADYGRYPHRFRNNTSKRSRSCYITASTTHTKTHALSNEAFNRIVSEPCRYCGKRSDPPNHHNGLDRLDSSHRVYTEDSCVSCCGDCNVMKYTHAEHVFLEHAEAVAKHNVGRDEFPADAEGAGEGEAGEGEAGAEEVGAEELMRDEGDAWGEEEAEAASTLAAPRAPEPPEANPFAAFAFGG